MVSGGGEESVLKNGITAEHNDEVGLGEVRLNGVFGTNGRGEEAGPARVELVGDAGPRPESERGGVGPGRVVEEIGRVGPQPFVGPGKDGNRVGPQVQPFNGASLDLRFRELYEEGEGRSVPNREVRESEIRGEGERVDGAREEEVRGTEGVSILESAENESRPADKDRGGRQRRKEKKQFVHQDWGNYIADMASEGKGEGAAKTNKKNRKVRGEKGERQNLGHVGRKDGSLVKN